MPNLVAPPYLFFSKSESLLFSSSFKCKEGTESDWKYAQELSDILLKGERYLQFSRPEDLKPLDESLSKEHCWDNIGDNIFKKNKLKISLEAFRQLDEIDNASEHSRLIYISMCRLRRNIVWNYTIGINFSEVFLVPEGEEPPSHFRVGIDEFVTNPIDYKKKTSLFSYKFAKAFFNWFAPNLSNSSSTVEKLVHLYNSINTSHLYDLSLPVKKYPCLNSYFELATICRGERNQQLSDQDHMIITIDSLFILFELIRTMTWLPNLYYYKKKEFIIILKDPKYTNAEERTRIHDELANCINGHREKHKLSLQVFFQIILLTNEYSDHNLISLAPAIDAKVEGHFTPLAHEAGFYLSTSTIHSSLFQQFQKFGVTQLTEYSQLRSQQYQYTIDPRKTITAYCFAKERSPNYRISKKYKQDKLKAKVTLSITHQQELALTQECTQTVNEQVSQNLNTVHQSEKTVQQQSQQSYPYLELFFTVETLARELIKDAKENLPRITKNELLLEKIGHSTEYYRRHYSKKLLLEQIIHEQGYALNRAAHILGQVFLKEAEDTKLIYLYKHSVDNILCSVYFSGTITNVLYYFADGLDPTNCITIDRYFLGRTLTGFKQDYRYIPELFLSNTHYSKLALLSNNETNAYRDHTSYSVLLSEEQLSSVPEDHQKALLIQQAEALLNLFKPHAVLNIEQIRALENSFKELIRFYYPNEPGYLLIIEKLFSYFEEHNEDNLRIVLQVLIRGHTKSMEDLLKYLSFLDSRCLLTHCYKIFFKYALDSCSLYEQLFCYDNDSGFNRIAARTPMVASDEDWPAIIKFFHGITLYAAKNNLQILINNSDEIERFWKRLCSKFLMYSGNDEQEAEKIMGRLIKSLITPDGLSLGPLRNNTTLFKGLEQLIDHCISKHTLNEQIDEIAGTSLLWTDAPYAITHNGFNVICPEMNIYAGAINQSTKRYSVTTSELTHALEYHKPQDGDLKTIVFRYLGSKNLREELDFYRQIHNQLAKGTKGGSLQTYLHDLMFGYFVLNMTGKKFKSRLMIEEFSVDFRRFLQNETVKKSLLELSANATPSLPELITASLSQLAEYAHPSIQQEGKGTINLWSVWHEQGISAFKDQVGHVPDIFMRRFDKKQLMKFILSNSVSICTATSALSEDQILSYTLIKVHLGDFKAANFVNTSISLLKRIYPCLNMSTLMNNILKIALFIDTYSLLVKRGSRGKIYVALHHLFKETKSIDIALNVTKLLSHAIAEEYIREDVDARCADFLSALSIKTSLLSNTAIIKRLLTHTLDYYLSTQIKSVSIRHCLELCDTLSSLDGDIPVETLIVLLNTMRLDKGHRFFSTHRSFTAEQLLDVAQILNKASICSNTIIFLELCLNNESNCDFKALIEVLKDTGSEQNLNLITLCTYICTHSKFPIIEQLTHLKKLSKETLRELVHLNEFYKISPEQVTTLMNSPSIPEAIRQFESNLFATNKERYDYNSDELSLQIAKIKFKSYTVDEDIELNTRTQKKLMRDYDEMMSYMITKPILIEKNEAGIKVSFTVNQLSETQVAFLFNALKEQISKGTKKHQYQLMLLALSCEAMYRICNKFPRTTQILSLLNTMNHKESLIHEIQTGEGKSIIAALHAVLLCAEGRTVDIATENNQLASDGLKKFKRFYEYLHIPYAKTIIEAHSPHESYIEQGINYSTASGLSLFRTQMQINAMRVDTNASLICDEIDASLTTTVQYRLAATLNPMLRDTTSWSSVYETILDFVQEQEIFMDNQCSKEEDLSNLTNYFLLKKPDHALGRFFNQIPADLLQSLIESALIANQLEEDIDYLVMKKEKKKTFYYAAPILSSTNRPDANIRYSSNVQQFLHTKLNRRRPSPKYSFEIEASSETLVVVSAKNFFDFYRHNGARTIGFTGTAGTSLELAEFFKHNGLVAYSYPSFHEPKAQNLGLLTASCEEKHKKLILKWIEDHKAQVPSQPILIITSSPQATLSLKEYLASVHTEWRLQSYVGYEQGGQTEEAVIHKAGKNNSITVANQSLARGADINPLHQQGIVVINACISLTASDLRQIQGRSARNGKPGQYISIINTSTLKSEVRTTEHMNSRFKAHQHAFSMVQQKERLKTRLLEEVRHHIMEQFFIKARGQADKILRRQYGRQSSLVDAQDYLLTLSQFNQFAEQKYAALLENHTKIEGAIADEFYDAMTGTYQAALSRWFPEEKYRDFKAIEPLIMLENLSDLSLLNSIKIEVLIPLSEFLSLGWQELGHQNVLVHLALLDKLEQSFAPYFSGSTSFKQACGQALRNTNRLDADKIKEQFDALEETLHELLDSCLSIPTIGNLVPINDIKKFISTYLTETKAQIQENKWDEIGLPILNLSSINLWFSRLTNMLTLGSWTCSILSVGTTLTAGPIPFIIYNIGLPAVLGWLKSWIKHIFSGSESTTMQLLASLDDISTDLGGALSALASLAIDKNISLGLFLDKIAPLLKNKTFLTLIVKYLEHNELHDFIPYLNSLPSLLTALEPYREKTFKELINTEILLSLFQQCWQSEAVKKIFEKSPFKQAIARCSELPTDFFSSFTSLSIPQFIHLSKVLAHPNFYLFLKELPPKTSFEDMMHLLSTEPEGLSPKVTAAVLALKEYQSNHERIAEESIRSFAELKERFTLTTDKLKAELASLKPFTQPPTCIEKDVPTTEQKTPWLKYAAYIALFACAITYNILYFSIPAFITGLLIMGSIVFPYIKNAVTEYFWPKDSVKEQSNIPASEESVQPICLTITRDSSELKRPMSTLKPSKTTAPSTMVQSPRSHDRFVFFQQAIECNANILKFGTTGCADQFFKKESPISCL